MLIVLGRRFSANCNKSSLILKFREQIVHTALNLPYYNGGVVQ